MASIEEYRKNVQQLMEKWVLTEIADSEKLYLLHGRKEPRKGKAPIPVALKMRNYLEVTTPKHRDAVVSIALSTHKLAVERLRWNTPSVQRENRLCRMCVSDVETPEHVLFRCMPGSENDDEDLTVDDLDERAKVVEKMHDLRRCFWHDLARVTTHIILEIFTR